MFGKAKKERKEEKALEMLQIAVRKSSIMLVPVEKVEMDFKNTDTYYYERRLGALNPGRRDGGHYEAVLVIERQKVTDNPYPKGMSEWTAKQLGYPDLKSHTVDQPPYIRLFYSWVPSDDFMAHISEVKRWLFPDLRTLWQWLKDQLKEE